MIFQLFVQVYNRNKVIYFCTQSKPGQGIDFRMRFRVLVGAQRIGWSYKTNILKDPTFESRQTVFRK